DDGVGLAVAGARRAIEVQVDGKNVGGGQVVDSDGVGAAEGVEVDRLDAAEVHGDVADIAGEPDAMEWRAGAAVGDVELLREVRAVEHNPVPAAALPVDHVAAIAGVPLERVVAAAHA